MATDKAIIDASATYIRIESVANIFSLAFNFVLVGLVTLGKDKYVYILTAVKLVLCLLVDTFMVSTLPVSLNLGVNGIAFSNIIVNVLLVATAIVLLHKEGITLFKKEKLSFGWMKEFAKVGGVSGLESFVRNIAYMLMIARMVNMVGEQGTYWVANNFIWGWLLLPVIQLGELIKQEVSTDKKNVRKNSLGYFSITAVISALWFVSIPVWKPFMVHVLGFTDVDKLFELVMVLVGFYVLYAIQNVFDATFYGLGKTNYMLFESVVINYRPVLIQEYLEASYPSSTTLLVLCVMPTAILQFQHRIKNKVAKRIISWLIVIFMGYMVIGRLVSGVHWLSDIIGGILLSAGLVYLYRAISNT